MISSVISVVYFDQRTGASHAVRRSKLLFFLFFCFFSSKKEEKRTNFTEKHPKKGCFLAFGSYSQKLVVTLLRLEKCEIACFSIISDRKM